MCNTQRCSPVGLCVRLRSYAPSGKIYNMTIQSVDVVCNHVVYTLYVYTIEYTYFIILICCPCKLGVAVNMERCGET